MEKEEEASEEEEEEEEEGKRNQLFSAEECADLDFKNNSPSNPRRRWRLSAATAAPVYFGLLQNKFFLTFDERLPSMVSPSSPPPEQSNQRLMFVFCERADWSDWSRG
ncbi:hypothetical protein TYRP_006027 [Tyrophagus putrescentiae]|nr:hypothetical protein TYRP_006027 [Tyrophagus putrescentiae]